MTEIACHYLNAKTPDGTCFELSVRIGTPYQIDDLEWACPVSLEPLHTNLRDIHGISSLQALCLALSLAKTLLEGFLEDGGQLFDENWEAFALHAVFGKSRPDI